MPGTFGYADPLFLLLAALALEFYLGRGDWLESLFRRPRRAVVGLAGSLEERLNRRERSAADRRWRGWVVALGLVLMGGFAGWLLALLTRFYPFAWPLELLLLLLVVRQRRTRDQAMAVAAGLEENDLPAARAALSRLAAGDLAPFQAERLPKPAMIPLAMAGLARRLNDSLVTPIFWYVLLGPGGLLLQQVSLLLARLYGGGALNGSEQEAPAGIFAQGALRLCRGLEWVPAQVTALLLLAGVSLLREPAKGEGGRDALWSGAGRRQWPERLLLGLVVAPPWRSSMLRLAIDLFTRAALLQAGLLVLLLLARLVLA